MEVSALIPYKADHGRRDFLWSVVKQRYEHLFPQIELCIGHDETEPFCRARAINLAAKIATGQIYMLVDSDVLFDVDLINKIMLYIHVHPWIVPFDRGIRLTQTATDHLIGQEIPTNINIKQGDIQEIITYPGPFMNIMTKACFEAIRGLDERFQGWGREDDAMVMSLDTICGKHFQMKDTVYHLWHQPAEIIPELLHKSDLLLNRYIDAQKCVTDMKRLIDERF